MTFQLRPWVDFFRSWALNAKEKSALDLLAATEDLVATKEFVAWESAVGAVAQAFNFTLAHDPATGHITAITPPPATNLSSDGRPSGTNRGGLMPPGT